jgi:carboxy-terminal domain RNA polymerase II polypeptide A small phosphatase
MRMLHVTVQLLTPAAVASASPAANTAVPPPRSSSKGPPSAEDPPRTASKSSEAGESGAAPAGEPKKKRSLLNIPRSNSLSNDSQTPTGTGLSGATVADSESIGRGSKRSFLGKRRAGSAASSKRSQQQPATSEKVEQAPPVPATDNREGSTRSKTRKSGGLLSCLPCFAPKESRSTGDDAPTENAKQAAKAKPVRTTQATPVKKQDPTAESSTADSKEPLDEKAAGETYVADQLEKPHGDGTTERPSNDAPPKIVTRSSSTKQSAEPPLPPLPTQPGTLQTGHPQINVQSPTPGTTPVQPRPSHEQQQIIHDRTQSQEEKDQDIEMKDVPLAASDVRHEGDESSSEVQNDVPLKVDLPPPPPLEQRRDAVRDQTSETSISEPQQKYLLGPLRPEFKGKKCLVLDLDETLVHSSFKVS